MINEAFMDEGVRCSLLSAREDIVGLMLQYTQGHLRLNIWDSCFDSAIGL